MPGNAIPISGSFLNRDLHFDPRPLQIVLRRIWPETADTAVFVQCAARSHGLLAGFERKTPDNSFGPELPHWAV
jgi:hypothetical protein